MNEWHALFERIYFFTGVEHAIKGRQLTPESFSTKQPNVSIQLSGHFSASKNYARHYHTGSLSVFTPNLISGLI